MERDINRHQTEFLVRQITEERERFVVAWNQGAGFPELNQIRQNIKKLNDLLWETTIQYNNSSETYRSDYGYQRDPQNRQGPSGNKP
jgi:hypothetical protein